MTVIVHFITRDKFTTGYINFMNTCMTGLEHHFFVTAKDTHEVNPLDERKVHYYNSMRDVMLGRNLQLLQECQKIIISGVWDTRMLLALRRDFVRKCYLQFWGGDFYGYRFSRSPGVMHPLRSLKWFVRRCIHHQFIKHCAGTISLISADIDELLKIFPNNAKHFTAPMPFDPTRLHEFNELFYRLVNTKHEGSTVTIIAGNSAQRPNNHKGIFRMLAYLKDADIEILSPLSYGDDEYRNAVIRLGHKIFGNKFKPIVDFMSIPKYIEFLASCDVAIFNHNQQAAMGNISLLLRLGKKVYIREDTAMWEHFRHNMKYDVSPVSELRSITLQQLADFPQELAYNNIHIAEEYAAGTQAVTQWRKVFDD